MRGKNRYQALLAVLVLVGCGASFFGCSSDDNVAPAQPTLSGQPLNGNTMQQAAAVSANEVEFFKDISTIFAGLVVKVLDQTSQAPAFGPAPLAPVPLGSSGLCLPVPAATVDTVTWNDNDNNSLPSPGDTLTVNLQNCAFAANSGQSILSGSPNPALQFTFDNVTGPVITGTLVLNFKSVDSFDNTDISTITGKMRASFSGLSFPAVDIILGQINGTAANTFATIEDSVGRLDFGCFDVKLNFPVVTVPFNFTSDVRGIAKIKNLSIMQLGDYAVATDNTPLNFVGGIPVSGDLKLLSFDNRAASGLPICYQPATTGTTSQLVTALPDKTIRLDTFKNTTWTPPVDNTSITNWGALTGL